MKFKHPTVNIQQAQQQSACTVTETESFVSSQQSVPIYKNAPSTSTSSCTNDEFLLPPAKHRKIQPPVSDNAAYIKKAISQELGWKHFGCAAHTINLIVQEATEKSVLIKSVIDRVKVIVAYFKRSTKATQKLDEFQKQNGATQPKRLLEEVPTRWNSRSYMLERIVEIQDAVKSSIAILGATSLPNLTPEDWLLCNETCKVLKCFEEASKYLSGENYLTASQLLIILKGITRVLKMILTSDSSDYHYLPTTCDFVRALLHLTNSRFENIENR
ncbi:unnamed protein product [Euphydryas editha]|uniref:Zinc finger BED domain-containing protein 4 n=1 Tax=Euphydryas editha TaxID=104508 RepID=A0AAU9UU42_EUPED|nr:unnamed protein product [Euphydryas editha]